MKRILGVSGLLLTSVLAAVPASAAKKPAAPYDFNGDGRRDVLVVSTDGYVKGQLDRGVLAVLYGGTGKKQTFGADEPALLRLPDGAWQPEHAVSADFDRDGYADVAVSGGTEGDGGRSAIVVVYGSKKGLSSRIAQLPKRAVPAGSYFSDDLITVGDFDGDGRPDLAAALTGYNQPWQVFLFRNVGKGRPTVEPVKVTGIGRAARLTAGDFTGDGRSDLAVNTLVDDEAGQILLLKGTPTGLGAATAVPGTGAWYDSATGDVTGDGRADLVVGGRTRGLGTIRIYPGTASGLGAPVSFTKQTKGIPGSTKANLGDSFGSAIALGDLDKDGRADLAIGDPSDGNFDRGSVTIVYGAKKGYTTKHARLITEESKGVPTASHSGERFGAAVQLLDVTGDRRPDLVVGAPFESRFFLFRTVKGRVATPVKAYGAAAFKIVGKRDGDYNGTDFGLFGR